MNYIDGMVAAVPTENKALFLEHAKEAATVFKDHGAVKVVEAWGDDVPDGEVTSFPMAVQCQAGESIAFSWIVWPSKEVRDAGMEKVMTDPRLDPEINPMPFDGKRMIFGGFQIIMEE